MIATASGDAESIETTTDDSIGYYRFKSGTRILKMALLCGELHFVAKARWDLHERSLVRISPHAAA